MTFTLDLAMAQESLLSSRANLGTPIKKILHEWRVSGRDWTVDDLKALNLANYAADARVRIDGCVLTITWYESV